MRTRSNPISGRGVSATSTGRRTGHLVAVLAAVGLFLAACGDDEATPEVASVDSTTTTEGTSEESSGSDETSSPDPVAFAQCMRDHGVPGFPDPNSDGTFEMDADEMGIPPDSPQFTEAHDACEHLLPQPSAEDEAESYEAQLAYAQCMRDEGLTDFPDPPNSSGPSTESATEGEQQNLGFDPESPVFQAAHEACKHHLPAGQQDGPNVNQGSPG